MMERPTPPSAGADEVARLAELRITSMRAPLTGGTPTPARSGLPPGPRIPWGVQIGLLTKYRHTFMPWLAKKFGDAVTVSLGPGRTIVLLSDPDEIKEVFSGSSETFLAGKANVTLGPAMGRHSLLLIDGIDHKRARRMLMPAFNGAALQGYRAMVAEVAAAEVATWGDGDQIRALDRMNALTLEVILRVVFGVVDEDRLARLRPLIAELVAVPPYVLMTLGQPGLRKVGHWRQAERKSIELDRLLYAQINETRSDPALTGRTDVLSRLLQVDDDGERLGDEEVRDQLITLLLAGFETTASALAWTLQELGSDPHLLRRSMEAVDRDDRDWLDAVFKESLRLHPIIPFVLRILTEPAVIGGRHYPAGVTLAPWIAGVQARDDLFPSAAEFVPERFLGKHPLPNTWIPFGGGARRCIGAGFAQLEAVEVLKQILGSYEFEAVGDETPEVRNISTVPARGARLRLKRR